MTSKKLSILGIMVAGSLLCLLVVAYVLIRTYDYNTLKPKIAHTVKQATHRELDIAGDIQLGLGLEPRLQVADVRFQNASWGSRLYMLSVKRIEVILKWKALITGSIEIQGVRIIEPDFLLETNEKGESNLPTMGSTEKGGDRSRFLGGVPGSLMVKKGLLTIQTGKPGSAHRFHIQRGFAQMTQPSPRVYKVENLEIEMTRARINGAFQMDMSGKRPYLTGRITSSEADVAGFMGWEDSPKKDTKSDSSKLFSDDPLPFEVLNRVDAKMDFSVKALAVSPSWTIRDFEAKAKLENGHLQVDPIAGTMAQGKVEGQLDIRAAVETPYVSTTFRLDHLSLSKIPVDSQDTQKLQGNVDLEVDVTGKGRSIAAIMSTLNGEAQIRMKDGHIANPYIKKLDVFGTDFSTGVFRLLNPFEKHTQETVITCFVCRFHIHKGIVESEEMVFNTPQMVVAADGKANLKTEQLDFSFKPSPKKGMGIKGLAQINLSLDDLTRPFKLGGTLTHPSLTIDPTQSALVVGKALGGAVLFGPVGIAAILLSGDVAGHQNPCLAAIEAAKKKELEAARKKGSSARQGTEEKTEKDDDQFVNEVVGQ